VLRTKVSAVPGFGNAVAAIAAALLPGTMIGLPTASTVLLPCALSDPLLLWRGAASASPLVAPLLAVLRRVLLLLSPLRRTWHPVRWLLLRVLLLLLGMLLLLSALLWLRMLLLLRRTGFGTLLGTLRG
jgi:hypothetical protein